MSFLNTALRGPITTGLSSAAAVASLLGVAACKPDLPHTPPQTFVTAVFDPTASKVPLPNDLVFLGSLNATCPPPANTAAMGTPPMCAQAELLASFAGQFPNDQEVAITIDFAQTAIAADGTVTQTAPSLDVKSFTPSTFLVVADTASGGGALPIDPIADSDYVKSTDHGTLTLHNLHHAPWAPGSYAVFVRGGDAGVHTTDNIAVSPSQIFALIAQGKDLTDPANLGLLRAAAGSTAAAVAQGQMLAPLVALYNAAAFPLVDPVFPHQELAILTTFKISADTNVPIDAARGALPLPIDLLRGADGKLTPVAACTLAGGALSAAGTCSNPGAAGFLALDGFSTTGAILAPTSGLIQAATVTADALQLYDLSVPDHPARVPDATLVREPCEFTSDCGSPTALSPVIALQPAGATAGDATSIYRTKPLKDNTDYAVVITNAIHDKTGRPIGAGTVARILGFTNPVVVGGHSALLGVDDATAAALDKMRLQLQPVYAAVVAAGAKKTDVAMAYTFHTQTILTPAVQLAALPYSTPAATALPSYPLPEPYAPSTVDDVFKKYGGSALPHSHIAEVIEADILTFDLLDPATGAFHPDPTLAKPVPIHVLITTPVTGVAPSCGGGSPARCAPLVVFRHGLSRGRIDMLTVADTFAANGMVTVAIDAAKHGDRALCSSGAVQTGCLPATTCTAIAGAAGQGDAHPPGTCDGGFIKVPLNPAANDATDGVPAVSGNYLVSANFFRTRDTLRQDVIDQSQLIRALALDPTAAASANSAVFAHLADLGLVIDPTKIYFTGQSLGAIQGTVDVAANPRISKAAFNVGGGTLVDIFTQSPEFVGTTNQLLAGLGIEPGTAAYLQFLVVAKTVLDPADPINFAGHLTAAPSMLPNLLVPATPTGPPLQAVKAILTQNAYCDSVVPFSTNFVWASNIGTGPLSTDGNVAAPATSGTAQLFTSATIPAGRFGACAAGDVGAVSHGFLTDWTNAALATAAQTDIVNFFLGGTLPLSVRKFGSTQ